MNKEKLRCFKMPMNKVFVEHAAPLVKEICQEYWLWENDQWVIRCDWFKESGTVTCLHCETEHNWKTLLKMAEMFGYQDD
jgi:hypothetical protein